MPSPSLLSNGRYTVLLTGGGGGVSTYGAFALTGWEADRTRDADGFFVYLRDRDRGTTWSATPRPMGARRASYATASDPGRVRWTSRHDGIEATLEVCVAPRRRRRAPASYAEEHRPGSPAPRRHQLCRGRAEPAGRARGASGVRQAVRADRAGGRAGGAAGVAAPAQPRRVVSLAGARVPRPRGARARDRSGALAGSRPLDRESGGARVDRAALRHDGQRARPGGEPAALGRAGARRVGGDHVPPRGGGVARRGAGARGAFPDGRRDRHGRDGGRARPSELRKTAWGARRARPSATRPLRAPCSPGIRACGSPRTPSPRRTAAWIGCGASASATARRWSRASRRAPGSTTSCACWATGAPTA